MPLSHIESNKQRFLISDIPRSQFQTDPIGVNSRDSTLQYNIQFDPHRLACSQCTIDQS